MSRKKVTRLGRVALAKPQGPNSIQSGASDGEQVVAPYLLRWDRYAASRMHDFSQR